jgi:ribonuclease Z
MSIKVHILGCNGAIPAYGRHPTCQIIDVESELIMLDCGEGAQIQMQKYSVRQHRIKHICISHMHGDHYFGLIGWLTTAALLGREAALTIYAPAALKHIINAQLDHALPYPISFVDLVPDQAQVLHDNAKIEIMAFPVDHSVPCHGFRITKKHKPRVVLPEQAKAYEIPAYFLAQLAEGKDYCPLHGAAVKNELVTSPGKPNIVYAYSADTGYYEAMLPYIAESDLLYHEATYTTEHIDKATSRKHSTAEQAATIAKLGTVKQLIIGHYSSKYKDVNELLQEAQSVFANTIAAQEGIVINVGLGERAQSA